MSEDKVTLVEKVWGQALKPGEVVMLDDNEAVELLESNNRPPAAILLMKAQMLRNDSMALMRAKNHDYTGGGGDPYANFRMAEALGVHPVVGILLRMGDKMQRIRTFAEKGELKVQGEGFKDACMDMHNYIDLLYGLATEGDTNG